MGRQKGLKNHKENQKAGGTRPGWGGKKTICDGKAMQ